jgi:autotransporter adhesin
VGVSTVTGDNRWVIKAGLSSSTRGDVAAVGSAGFQF